MNSARLAISRELDDIEELSNKLNRSVTIFGSARTPSDSQEFALTKEIARNFAQSGYAVISGGGPGIMRAASEGAQNGGGTAIGLNINLPFEEPDLSQQDISLTFDHLFTRKVGFAHCSQAFIVMPGGIGTLDELFEILALVKTQKLSPRPIALVGRSFWSGLLDWLQKEPVRKGLLSQADLVFIGVFDNTPEVIHFVEGALDPSKLSYSTGGVTYE